MPSWRVHKAIYEKLCDEVQGFIIWTPELLDRIDKIIDGEYGEHDLGRKFDTGDFQRMLSALWLEFGDIYDTLTGKFLNASYYDKLKFRQEVLWNPKLVQRYMIEIPDDVLVLATLHHILDVATYCLLNIHPPITVDESDLIFECAKRLLRHYANQLKELKTMDELPFDEVFDWLIDILKEKSREIYTMLTEYLRSKGLEPGYGDDVLKDLLSNYVRDRGYYGIICVNGTPLPLAAAARKAYSELTKGREVVIGFSLSGGPYPVIHEELRASSVKELFEKLQSLRNE
mgnify:CR=1 FL=1